MTTFDKIKRRARSIAERRDDGNLGPNRGTMDQEQARIERAKQEARREAKRERTQQRVEEARQEERQRVLEGNDDQGLIDAITSTVATAADAVDDNDGERADDVRRAMGTDFDGDGETFAEEMGLQSAARADAEDRKFTEIEDDLDALLSQSERDGGSNRGQRAGRQSRSGLDLDSDEFGLDFDDIGGGRL